MSFRDELGRAWKILLLDSKTIDSVANDEDATKYAFIFAALTGLLAAVLNILFSILGFFFMVGLVYIVWYPLALLVVSGIYFLLAKIFGGKGSYTQLLRVYGYALVATCLSFIPVFGWLIGIVLGIWYLVILYTAIKQVHKLSGAKAAIVVAIPVIVAIMVAVLVAILIFAGVLEAFALG